MSFSRPGGFLDQGRKFELAREEEFCEAAIGELFSSEGGEEDIF